MANEINPIMALFENEPALLRADKADWFASCCQIVAAHSAEIAKIEAADDFWFSSDDWRSAYRPYKVQNGILTVPVKGLLLNNFSIIVGTFATGYDYIWKAVQRGMADPQVKGIVFSVDSGGGMVSGNFDLVDRIYALRGKKPMRTITTDGAYSAAYSIASVTDRIIMGRTAGVGSIGVVTTHMEQSKALEARGITVSIIRSKERKYEGNALEPLTEAARTAMQDRVNAMHNEFVAIVARNRGMDASKVDATDALTFMPEEAISRGLADESGSPEDAFTAFVAFLNSEQENEPMAEQTQAGITEEAHTAAVATATTQGADNERARISAILGSEEAKQRPTAAQMFAFDMNLSAEDTLAKLAKLPVETPQQAAAPVPAPAAGAGAGKELFTAAMNGTENPGLNAEGGENPGEPQGAAGVLAMAEKFGIKGFTANK
ncbi:capsid maturation protease [Rhodobacter phage RcCWillis]|nr:capsid maturation protease [Rhodobacter phage RcCWillis]